MQPSGSWRLFFTAVVFSSLELHLQERKKTICVTGPENIVLALWLMHDCSASRKKKLVVSVCLVGRLSPSLLSTGRTDDEPISEAYVIHTVH